MSVSAATPTAAERRGAAADRLVLFHFNDVYHATSAGAGGAARFATALAQARQKYGLPATRKADDHDATVRPNVNIDHATVDTFQSKQNNSTLTLFSGDLFNPSLESGISKGKHMVSVINALAVDVSVFGNHDFDFGVPQLVQLTADTNFPWLMSNVFDGSDVTLVSSPLTAKADNAAEPAKMTVSESRGLKPLANGRQFIIMECAGYRIGVVGLVEKEWLDTINSLPPNLVFSDFVQVGRDLARKLKNPEPADGFAACDFVLALTHMRLPNDELLAEQVPEIDLVLGGHDHFIKYVEQKGRLRVVKSGTDFRDLSVVELSISKPSSGRPTIDTIKVLETIHVDDTVPEMPGINDLLRDVESKMSKTLQKAIFITHTALDATSPIVRLEESTIGNLVADILRWAYACDIGFLCGGSIRSDLVYGPGEITVRDVMEMFPFEDPVVVIGLTGQMIWDALENGVSEWPKQEGRFPQISGLKFEFDPSRPPSKRVLNAWTVVKHVNDGEPVPLDLAKVYTVATREYMSQGKDGYTALADPVFVQVDHENGNIISSLIRKYFIGLKTLKVLGKRSSSSVDHTKVLLHAASKFTDALQAKDAKDAKDDKDAKDAKDANGEKKEAGQGERASKRPRLSISHDQLPKAGDSRMVNKISQTLDDISEHKQQIDTGARSRGGLVFDCANMYGGVWKKLKHTAQLVAKLPVVSPQIEGRIVRKQT